MKKKKRSNRRKWLMIAGIAIPSICAIIFLGFMFTLAKSLDIVGYDSCSNEPEKVQRYARFNLPPSYDNLWASCGGMQGWWAEAHFDMSPDDLDTLIDSLWLEVELSEFSDGLDDDMKRHLVLSEEERATIQTGFYGYTKSGDDLVQKIIIDTTNPELYRVYLVILGG